VGINTSAPSQKLHVIGTGLFSSGVMAPIYCDEAGLNCKDVANILTAEIDGSTTNEVNTNVAWDDTTNTFSVTDPFSTKSAVIS